MSALLELIAEDKRAITYRPRLKRKICDFLATILFQQIVFRWHANGREPFYKFLAPCGHDDYVTGDSWSEELEASKDQVYEALKKIGTKITAGVSKKDALAAVDIPHLVIYWTDSNRKTWYQLNEVAAERMVREAYAPQPKPPKKPDNRPEPTTRKAENSTNLEDSESPDSSSPTEMNTEMNNKEKEDSAPAKRRGVGAVVDRLWDFWKQVNRADIPVHLYELTPERDRKIQARLKSKMKWTESDIRAGILGMRLTPWNMGEHEETEGRKLLDIELCCRNDTTLERYIRTYRAAVESGKVEEIKTDAAGIVEGGVTSAARTEKEERAARLQAYKDAGELCPRCHNVESGMEVVPGKGARACPHTPLTEEEVERLVRHTVAPEPASSNVVPIRKAEG